MSSIFFWEFKLFHSIPNRLRKHRLLLTMYLNAYTKCTYYVNMNKITVFSNEKNMYPAPSYLIISLNLLLHF